MFVGISFSFPCQEKEEKNQHPSVAPLEAWLEEECLRQTPEVEATWKKHSAEKLSWCNIKQVKLWK